MGGKGGGGVGSAATRAGASQFWASNPARVAMFKQLASALSTGGCGMRSGFVHGAIARSREMGVQALRNASGGLSGVDPSIASRVLNRISRTNDAATGSISTNFAKSMIDQAPAAILGAAQGQNAGYQAAAIGEEGAQRAVQTRAAGWGSAASSMSGILGSLAARQLDKMSDPTSKVPASGGTGTAPGPWASSYVAPTWFDRFRS
jgi:hypothetical protein